MTSAPDVTGGGELGRLGAVKRDVDGLSQTTGKKSLAAARRAHHQDVGLVSLGPVFGTELHALDVLCRSVGQTTFGCPLANGHLVEQGDDFSRRLVDDRFGLGLGGRCLFLRFFLVGCPCHIAAQVVCLFTQLGCLLEGIGSFVTQGGHFRQSYSLLAAGRIGLCGPIGLVARKQAAQALLGDWCRRRRRGASSGIVVVVLGVLRFLQNQAALLGQQSGVAVEDAGLVEGVAVALEGGRVVRFAFIEMVVHFAVNQTEVPMHIGCFGAVGTVGGDACIQHF